MKANRKDWSFVAQGAIYRNNKTGEHAVDDNSLRRTEAPRLSGEATQGFGYEDEDFGDDEDEFGDDEDEFGDDEDEFGDDEDDFGDDEDDFGDDEQPADGNVSELGAVSRKGKRKRTQKRRSSANARRASKTGNAPSNQRTQGSSMKRTKRDSQAWGQTQITGEATLGGAGTAIVVIRPPFVLKAEDITFEGSTSGAKVQSIMFGDQMAWHNAGNSSGTPVTVFGPNNRVRNALKGQVCERGMDITITGTLTGAGTLVATIFGQKPIARSC